MTCYQPSKYSSTRGSGPITCQLSSCVARVVQSHTRFLVLVFAPKRIGQTQTDSKDIRRGVGTGLTQIQTVRTALRLIIHLTSTLQRRNIEDPVGRQHKKSEKRRRRCASSLEDSALCTTPLSCNADLRPAPLRHRSGLALSATTKRRARAHCCF